GPSYLFTLSTTPDERTDTERMSARVQVEHGEHAFAQSLFEGRTMTPEQALSAQEHPVLASHPHASASTDCQQVPPRCYGRPDQAGGGVAAPGCTRPHRCPGC